MKDVKKYIPQFLLFLAICVSCVAFLAVSGDSSESTDDEIPVVSEQSKTELAKEEKIQEGILGCHDTDSSVVVDVPSTPAVSENDSANVSVDVEVYDWFSVESYNAIMYATSSVNIRLLPSVNYTKLGLLPYGDSVEVNGKCSNGWYRVLYNDGYAYISGNYLAVKEPDNLVAPEYSGFVVRDGNVDSKWLYKLEANYNKVPENVRLHFESNGWNIICTTQHLGEKFYGDSDLYIQAVNSVLDKQIWVEARDAAMTSIVHELGHYIDFNCNWVSDSEEFDLIYAEEVQFFKSIVSTHENNTNTASEYFAEAYAISIEYPDLMRQYCPKTFEYVMRYSNSL